MAAALFLPKQQTVLFYMILPGSRLRPTLFHAAVVPCRVVGLLPLLLPIPPFWRGWVTGEGTDASTTQEAPELGRFAE